MKMLDKCCLPSTKERVQTVTFVIYALNHITLWEDGLCLHALINIFSVINASRACLNSMPMSLFHALYAVLLSDIPR